MTQHKNKIMNLAQFSDEYPDIYQHTPLGFITFYKRLRTNEGRMDRINGLF